MAEYKSLTVPAPAVDSVTFWKQKAEQFPIMSLTARRLLCASTVRAGFAVFVVFVIEIVMKEYYMYIYSTLANTVSHFR